MTDWNNLDGLDLRRAVYKLLGWDVIEAQFEPRLCIGRPPGHGTTERLPAIETSADISERILDEETKKRGVSLASRIASINGLCVQCWKSDDDFYFCFGATPSLVRARAIGMLAERDAK